MLTVLAAQKRAGITMERDAARDHAISHRPSRTFQLRLVAHSKPSHKPSGPVYPVTKNR